ncbi:MAG: hypothetical protein NZ580_02770 [Bacteroidia bacterium]|nr:hypothetical protein [Bacteroidia bacterium]MDW8235708.1 hypothetical protein [Bacteroidia bacterium]
MPYSPEEYEQLKEFYKQELRERKVFLQRLHTARLRQQAEEHLRQMEESLRRLGIEPETEPPSSPPSAPPPLSDPKTLF